MWWAASGPVDPTLNKNGLPGGDALNGLVGGLEYMCLLACVAAVIVGAAIWGLSGHSGNYQGAYLGRRTVLCGFVGAVLVGGGAAIVNFAFGVGQTI